jgi:hypothetical protein
MFWAAASPQGWPPPEHRAAARLRRAAAPQNTTDSHSETLCIELLLRQRGTPNDGCLISHHTQLEKLPRLLYHFEVKAFLM